MSHTTSTPKIFLTRREQIEDVLRYQVWADAQLHRHLNRVRHCVEMTRLGRMTTAGTRERLAIIARSMHAAVQEFARMVKALFDPATQTLQVNKKMAVPVPHGSHNSQRVSSWKEWQWQATHPAAGCLTIEASHWLEQRAVAEVWIQRNIHRSLAVRATGEYLALRMDGLERAGAMTDALQSQLKDCTENFWTHFTLGECVGLQRKSFVEHLPG